MTGRPPGAADRPRSPVVVVTAIFLVLGIAVAILQLVFGGAEVAGAAWIANVALVLATMGVVAADTAVLFVVRHTLAPMVTTVVDDSPPGGGCLER